jgi:SAM-dependent methyltransferase
MGCGFVALAVDPGEGRIAKANMVWFSREKAAESSRNWGAIFDRVDAVSPTTAPSAILDIGARNGAALAEARRRYVGAALYANEPVKVFHSALRAIGAQVVDFDVNMKAPATLIGHFDMVFFRHTLEHLDHPMQALATIRSLLSPDGVAYIEVPDAFTANHRKGQPFATDWLRPIHGSYFNRYTLLKLCESAGLFARAVKDDANLWAVLSASDVGSVRAVDCFVSPSDQYRRLMSWKNETFGRDLRRHAYNLFCWLRGVTL